MDRLQQLDQELCEKRTKEFDIVRAVRRDTAIRVCVERRPKGDFKAAAVIANKPLYSIGEKPSFAFVKLIRQIRWELDRLAVEANFTNGVSNRLN